ncbi:MAG: glycosyltransferase, partial [Phycisphaerales bacterium]|nr:glycosyltransferase [Phycisphaerales bacterium]
SGGGRADRAPSNTILVEVAWEVCNQLGGIYQVIKSKAPRMTARWGTRFYMLGPYNPAKAVLEFEARPVKAGSWIDKTIDDLKSAGLIIHHGRWLIPGRPRVLLVEHALPILDLDKVKYRLWADHGIECPSGDWLIDGVVSFADAARRVLWSMSHNYAAGLPEDDRDPVHDGPGAPTPAPASTSARKATGASVPITLPDLTAAPAATTPEATKPDPSINRRILAHFHEWMGGLCIPMLRKEQAPIATVFTTHATQLGRTLAFGDEWFYEHLPFVDHAAEAARCSVKMQHYAERACAHGSHTFTTVSPITGEECTHLLGRTPDLILHNGLSIENYNVGHEFQTYHAQFKERINRFVMGHFFPSYSFDLDKTIYFFTSGRYEPKNKGFDLCIEAMARLNAELKAQKSDKTVVFFIVTQRSTRSLHPRVLQSRGVLNELENVCDRVLDDLKEKLFREAAAGKRVNLDELVSEYWRLRYRRNQHAFKTDQLPMVVTHLLEDDQRDEVLNQIRNTWLFNRPDDRVKIVYHPEFISPTNPLWGMEYDQFVRGCHMGIFPSSYEPWGYTPLECVAMGVPAITSDLAGFGRYVEETHPDLASGFSVPRPDANAESYGYSPTDASGTSGGGGSGGRNGRIGS